MKGLLLIVFLASIALFSDAAPGKKPRKGAMGAAIKECSKKHGTKLGEIKKIVQNLEVPTTPAHECTMDCIITKLEWKKGSSLDKNKLVDAFEFNAAEKVKAKKVIKTCDKTGSPGKCSAGRHFISCLKELSKISPAKKISDRYYCVIPRLCKHIELEKDVEYVFKFKI